MTLGKGRYLIIGKVNFGSNINTGIRSISLTNGSDWNSGRDAQISSTAVSNDQDFVMNIREIYVDYESPISLFAFQNSGSDMTVYPLLYALRTEVFK